MARRVYEEANIAAIADKIREKTGGEKTYKAREMPDGVGEVYEAGKKAEYDAFWDAFQNYGNPKDYSTSFGAAWTKETFRPKHDIITTNAYMLFRGSQMNIDLAAHLDALGVTLDLSKASNTQYTFNSSKFTRVGVVDFSGSSGTIALDGTFSYCYNLVTIDKIVLRNEIRVDFGEATFTRCEALENLRFEGKIMHNGLNLQWSKKLSYDSLMNIINCLEDKTNDTSGTTWTVKLGAENIAKLTNEEQDIAWKKGWNLE